jgi:calcium permeable stress-gated cation channel
MLYVLQPKVDSKGACYAKALQHLLTGVYLSELCLIGLFGVRNAPGPSTLMIILLVLTSLYHAMINRVLKAVDANFAIDEEGETVPLLDAEEGSVSHSRIHVSTVRSKEIGLQGLPDYVSGPIADFVESYIASSRRTAKSWLTDPLAREDDSEVNYTDEEMKSAYLNPALTSKMPKLWLVRDEVGVSKHEIEENETAGIPSTDEAAFLDEKNRIRWAQDDFSKVPVFKKPPKY